METLEEAAKRDEVLPAERDGRGEEGVDNRSAAGICCSVAARSPAWPAGEVGMVPTEERGRR